MIARNSLWSGSWQYDASPTRLSLSSDPICNYPTIPINDKHQDQVPWIINHVLECRLSFELPLRIMFSFNAGHRVPTLKEAYKWWQYEPKGTAIIKFLSSLEESKSKNKEDETNNNKDNQDESMKTIKRNHAAQDPFMDPMNEALLDIDFASEFPDDKRASRGLPPEFIRKWCLDRVFTKVEELVDFSQALTGIDYLQDLECRRREALREVALRLKIDKNNWRRALSADPDAKKWVEDIQAQETIIGGFYASCYVDLRIWTMLHELKTQPFYKPNVLAMLNTLYPPCPRELPNDLIDRNKLRKHRAKFYNFIIEVAHEGIGALDEFETRLRNPECRHNWIDTRENLKDYIDLACKMIEQSNAIHDIMFFKKSAAVAHSMRSAHSRNTTASSTVSTRTERQGSQNDQPITAENTPFGVGDPASRHHSKSITQRSQSQEDPSAAVSSNSSSEFQHLGRAEERVHNRKRLASPKRQYEYSHEYHTIPMNAPRTLRSFATTPNLAENLSFPSPSNGGKNASLVHNQHKRPRANTSFIEQYSEAAQHRSFQSWVPLKDQLQASPSRQTSFPDPWSRGPPNPKYQLPPSKVSEDEKFLQVLREPAIVIRRRASFPEGTSPPFPASSANSTNLKSHKMYKGIGATSFETMRAGSSPHFSQQSSSIEISPRKQVEKALKCTSSAIQAYQALDLRELPGYPSALKIVAPENTQRPQLRTQKSYCSPGDLRGGAIHDFASTNGILPSSQQGKPAINASRKLQLRKPPLRDYSMNIPFTNLVAATSDFKFPSSQTTPNMNTPGIRLRRTQLHDTAAGAEMRTSDPPNSIPKSPLPLSQEVPITPTSRIRLRKSALHNSSIDDQARTSLSASKSSLPSPSSPATTIPSMEVRRKSKKLTKLKPPNDRQDDPTSSKSINSIVYGDMIDTPVRKYSIPQLSPNADLSFLDTPYEPPAEIRPKLKKKSSMATIIRKKSMESLKSVRFEDTEILQDNASSKTPRKSSDSSQTPRKLSGGSKSPKFFLGDDNALGISFADAQSTSALSRVSTTDSFMTFPPPPPPKRILKKQKSMGIFPRSASGSQDDSMDLQKQPALKKQKSLGLFPRVNNGKDKDEATQLTPVSNKSEDMGGTFDGSQQNCTAYRPNTVIACREPYVFPVPPNRIPINQDAVSQPLKSPAPPVKAPIIYDSMPKPKPAIRVNTANKSSAPSNKTPISPANKVYGFIPPPLKKQMSVGGWETDPDMVLEHEHRPKIEHAKAQSQHSALKHQPSTELKIDSTAPDSNQLRKTTSFAEDTPKLPPATPGSGKLGSIFKNAGANISAIFVGKNAPNIPDPSKSPKIPVSIPPKKEGKEKGGKLYQGSIGKSGTLATIMQSINPSHIFTKRSRRRNKSLAHKHKLIPTRKRELLLKRHFRIKGDVMQRYKRMYVLEASQREIYAEGIKWMDRYRPVVRESAEMYRRKEWMRSWLLEVSRGEREGLEKPAGSPFLKEESVRKGVRKGGRDTRRRVFEAFVEGKGKGKRKVGGRLEGVERVVEKIDWRKDGWFEEPRARQPSRELVESGEILPPVVKKKYVMISTEKYDRY